MCRSSFSTTIKLMKMLQTGITYTRTASKWWTYVSAEIYYSKQFSIFFLFICIHKIFRQKLSFLRILWQSNCPNIWWFCRVFKIVSDSTFNSISSTQIFLISSGATRSMLDSVIHKANSNHVLPFNVIHPRGNPHLLSNNSSPFAGTAFKEEWTYAHTYI